MPKRGGKKAAAKKKAPAPPPPEEVEEEEEDETKEEVGDKKQAEKEEKEEDHDKEDDEDEDEKDIKAVKKEAPKAKKGSKKRKTEDDPPKPTRQSSRLQQHEKVDFSGDGDVKILFVADTTIAIKKGSSFALAATIDDVLAGEHEFRVSWYKYKEKEEKYVVGEDGEAKTKDVLTRARIISQKGGKYSLSADEKKKIEKLLGEKADMSQEEVEASLGTETLSLSNLSYDYSLENDDNDGASSSTKKPRAKRASKRKSPDDEDGKPTQKGAKKRRTSKKYVITPNPKIKVIDDDPTLFDGHVEVNTECCSACSSKDVFRAIATNNMELLKNVFEDSDHVCSPFISHSADNARNVLQYAVASNNVEAVGIILKFMKERNNHPRADPPHVSLKTADTGSYSQYTYGHRVRKLNASRGGKEGNDAFGSDSHEDALDEYNLAKWALKCPKLSVECLEVLFAENESVVSDVNDNIWRAVRTGNRTIAGYLVQRQEASGGWGFNFLHKQALLNNKEDFTEFRKVSVTKKPNQNAGVTPLHMAAINPNVKYLRELLAVVPEYNRVDNLQQFGLIHYAAACEGSGPLEFLLSKGVSCKTLTHDQKTPLMIAAKYNRANNIKALLKAEKAEDAKRAADGAADKEKGKGKKKGSDGDSEDGEDDEEEKEHDAEEEEEDEDAPKRGRGRKKPAKKAPAAALNVPLADLVNKKKRCALHMAARRGNVDAVLALIAGGANVNLLDSQKLSALAHAAQRGQIGTVRALVKGGADLQILDKVKRQPIIHAVKNGQLEVASYLLQAGVDPNAKDSSENHALHYAAAYGWVECVKLLIKAGAEPDTQNIWKTTPLAAAIMKGHLGCADYLLSIKGVDINICDDKGRSLVTQALRPFKKSSLKQIKYLVEKKGADCSKADLKGNTPLHVLSRSVYTESAREKTDKLSSAEIDRHYIKIAEILVKKGADVNVKNAADATPLLLAVQAGNLGLAKFLVDSGTVVSGSIAEDSTNIFHQLAKHSMCAKLEIVTLLEALLQKIQETEKLVNTPDADGFTPLLLIAENFLGGYKKSRPTIQDDDEDEENEDESDSGSNDDDEEGSGEESEESEDEVDGETKKDDKKDNKKDDKKGDEEETYSDEEEDVEDLLKEDQEKTPEEKRDAHEEKNQRAREICVQFAQILLEKVKVDVSFAVQPLKKEDVEIQKAKETVEAENDDSDAEEEEEEEEEEGEEGAEDGGDANESTDIDTSVNSSMDTSIEKKDNKNPENEEEEEKIVYKRSGAYTAFHFLVSQHNSIPFLELLLSKNPKLEMKEHEHSLTPLHMAVQNHFVDAVNLFFKAKANPNTINKEQVTPLHTACASKNLEIIKILLNNGAKVDTENKHGQAALLLTAKDHDDSTLPIVKLLLKKGANANKVDAKKRSALHYCASSSKGDTDTSFELERLLIEGGANVNAQDYLGRTPLHYYFAKIGKQRIDPIESITSYCCAKGVQVDIPDNFGKTPLIYAAQRGATVSSIYLLKNKAKLEHQDEDKNTALGVAMAYDHPAVAVVLIEKGANIHVQVNKVKYLIDGVELGSAAGQSNNYGWNNRGREKKRKVPVRKWDKNRGRVPKKRSSEEKEEAKKANKKDKKQKITKEITSMSMYYLALIKDWQGVARMIMEAGHKSNLAMEDAIKASRFQLLSTLLGNSECGKTMLVRLAEFANSDTWMLQIAKKLLKGKKVAINEVDERGRTALHYAAARQKFDLCKYLIKKGIDVNIKDEDGKIALHSSVQEQKSREDEDNVLKIVNLLIPNSAKQIEIHFTHTAYTEGQTTLLIHAIRSKSIKIVKVLLAHGADPNFADEMGVTPLMHSVRQNSEKLVKYFIETFNENSGKPEQEKDAKNNGKKDTPKSKQIDLNAVDSYGRTVIHHVVNPVPFGSYENLELLKYLQSKGAGIDIEDTSGFTPLYYALKQTDGKLARYLETQDKVKPLRAKGATTFLNIDKWAESEVDYEEDAKAFIKKHGMDDDSAEDSTVEVDPHSDLVKTCIVHVDKDELIYDINMMKVDVKYGNYGQNNFYKMQLLYNKIRDIYVLFNRWGRVGDTGQHQSTPFKTEEEGTTEFKKIFKSKTGNAFGAEDFVRQKGKWKLMKRVNKNTKNPHDVLQKFDLKSKIPSDLPYYVQNAIKKMMNVSAMSQAMKKSGVDTSLLPLGKLAKEDLQEAKTILGKLKDLIVKQNATTPDVDKQAVVEEIADLSNRYYELVPQAGFKRRGMSSIQRDEDVKKHMDSIMSLEDIEIAAKILLGALHRKDKINPLDYCYKALNIKLEEIREDEAEHAMITSYVNNTTESTYKIKSVFRLTRPGEVERIFKWRKDPNHYLLWHGSPTGNFLGILSQGLRIAPPEAPTTGFLFGKGVYFSDTFQKSAGYCHSNNGFVLLSEVALGKIHRCTTFGFEGEQPTLPVEGTNSTKGVGKKGLDFRESVILPNGAVMPTGKMKKIHSQDKSGNNYYRNRGVEVNEYIVYDTNQVCSRYLVQFAQ